MKSISTPEEAEALTRDLLAPALMKLPQKSAEGEIDDPFNSVPSKNVSVTTKVSRIIPNPSPWYDVVENDTEAMVISLYAKGMTTRDIAGYMKNIHGVEMSQPAVSGITDKVFPLIKEWQTRPLSSIYPVVYLDGMHFKVREPGKVSSKVAYIALGVNQYGIKEVLGIWVSETEGAKFWLHVLNDLKNRGIDDIFFVCVDGLKGFPDAIKTIFPQAEVQTCIVHQIRHTIMFIPHKDKEQFCDDLKEVYTAPSEEAGLEALRKMMERWPQYASYLKSWETRWADLAPFFQYPAQIRRLIYTTNSIENLNRQFRKVTKTTTIFPHDDALLKLLWLAQADIAQGWVMAVRNWSAIMAQLSILFPDRVLF